MKITFIKPNIGRMEHSLYVDEGRMEPLMLGVLAGLTPESWDVVLYDDRIEDIPYGERTDVVAITVETYTARRAYEIADEYRARGVSVILGGIHVTLIPEEAMAHADCLVTGDAETVWGTVIEDAERGVLKKRYHGTPGIAQLGGTMPRRDIFAGKGYLPVALTQFSRGCKYECRFCAISKYFGRSHFIRVLDEVVKEVSSLRGRIIFFVDDNIASDRDSLKELCRALVPLRIRWVSQASLDVTNDAELMRLLPESGCLGNVMGFESITPESLTEARKPANGGAGERFKREIGILRDHGLLTWAAFTLGYDHDTRDSIMRTLDFALEHRFAFAAFNILMPYPGTELYKELECENRLLFDGRWWLHPSYRFNQAAFLPRTMSPDELTEACHTARKEFNSVPSIVRRLSDVGLIGRSLGRALSYVRYAALFRREVYKKNGMRFGMK